MRARLDEDILWRYMIAGALNSGAELCKVSISQPTSTTTYTPHSFTQRLSGYRNRETEHYTLAKGVESCQAHQEAYPRLYHNITWEIVHDDTTNTIGI